MKWSPRTHAIPFLEVSSPELIYLSNYCLVHYVGNDGCQK